VSQDRRRIECRGAAHGEDTPTADGDGFDNVVLHIDGVDLAAGEDDVRGSPAVCIVRHLHKLISYHWRVATERAG
jgi:hypothetical protein